MESIRHFFLSCYQLRNTLLIPNFESNEYPFGQYDFLIDITYGLGVSRPLLYEKIVFGKFTKTRGHVSDSGPIGISIDDTFLNIWLKTDVSLDNIMFMLEPDQKEDTFWTNSSSPPDYFIALRSIISLKYNINPITLFGEEEPEPLP